jgi:hypothetical protein
VRTDGLGRLQIAGRIDADLLRQIAPFVADDVTDDLVPIATAASRTRFHLERDACGDVVEEAPRRLEQVQLALQLLLRHGRLLE